MRCVGWAVLGPRSLERAVNIGSTIEWVQRPSRAGRVSRRVWSCTYSRAMSFIRHVVVLDAADVNEVSTFWAGFLDGRVVDDDERFHCVIDSQGEWALGVQHAPHHAPPRWPDGNPQQVHVDFHVTEPAEMHERAIALGAKLLQDGDMSASEGHRVYADPAGHPFCIGWGHPDAETLQRFLEQNPG